MIEHEATWPIIGIEPIPIPLCQEPLGRLLHGTSLDPNNIHTAGLLLTQPRMLLAITRGSLGGANTYVILNPVTGEPVGTTVLDFSSGNEAFITGHWTLAGVIQGPENSIEMREKKHPVATVWQFCPERIPIQSAACLGLALQEQHCRPTVPADLPMVWNNKDQKHGLGMNIATGLRRLDPRQALQAIDALCTVKRGIYYIADHCN